MENQEGNIHQLVIRYFTGRITLPDEKKLFEFVNASPTNRTLFRMWEKEWMLSGTFDLTVEHEWKQLQRRVQVQEAVSDIFSRKQNHLKRIIAVAAVSIAIILSGIYGLMFYSGSQMETNYFALETAYGEKSKMMLTDGTIVWLNAGSSLRYANDFGGKKREVIVEGEAYFEVKKQKNEAPFLVRTTHYNILVKGTKFNVTSYQEDPQSTITLLEGSIDILYEGKHLPVNPGESICFDKQKGDFSQHQVQAFQYKSWIEGRVEYDEISLNELAVRLSRKYDVRIHLDDGLNKKETFRVSLRNEETVNQILQALSEIIPIRFDRQDREIYIRKQ